MLRPDVVYAATQGQFHVYPIKDIAQGIALLTGIPAGEIDEHGAYPDGSIHALVMARLRDLTQKRIAFQHTETQKSVDLSSNKDPDAP